jgi:hypothetical protein
VISAGGEINGTMRPPHPRRVRATVPQTQLPSARDLRAAFAYEYDEPGHGVFYSIRGTSTSYRSASGPFLWRNWLTGGFANH